MAGMSIGVLALRADVKVANIRFYEESGLLPKPSRRQGGHREYETGDVQRLIFIRTSRALGFSLDQIKALLTLAKPENLDCLEAQKMSRQQLGMVRDRIGALQAIETRLVRHLEECTTACCGARAPECGLLPELG